MEISDFSEHVNVQRVEEEKQFWNPDGWDAVPNELHHGGWWRDLRQALDYALYRGNGRICAVEIFEPDPRGGCHRLAGQSASLTEILKGARFG